MWFIVLASYHCLTTHTYTNTHTEDGTSPHFLVKPASLTAYQTASLGCSGLGSPQPTVEWYKNDQTLIAASGKIELSDDELVISNLQASDAGAYHCELVNALGRVRSGTALLEVAGK